MRQIVEAIHDRRQIYPGKGNKVHSELPKIAAEG
jgi:hypothetical protein